MTNWHECKRYSRIFHAATSTPSSEPMPEPLIEKRKETEGRRMLLWQLCAAAPLHQLFSMGSSVAISDHYCPSVTITAHQ
jgi:hypothetical protein